MQEERGLNILQAHYINTLLAMNIIVKWVLSPRRYPSDLQNEADQISDIEDNLGRRQESSEGRRGKGREMGRERRNGYGGRIETVNLLVIEEKQIEREKKH